MKVMRENIPGRGYRYKEGLRQPQAWIMDRGENGPIWLSSNEKDEGWWDMRVRTESERQRETEEKRGCGERENKFVVSQVNAQINWQVLKKYWIS